MTGAQAYQTYGDEGYAQNPHIVGPGRELAARDWWLDFDAARRQNRKRMASAEIQKRAEEFNRARLDRDEGVRAQRQRRNLGAS